jgi:hypothetical protein
MAGNEQKNQRAKTTLLTKKFYLLVGLTHQLPQQTKKI